MKAINKKKQVKSSDNNSRLIASRDFDLSSLNFEVISSDGRADHAEHVLFFGVQSLNLEPWRPEKKQFSEKDAQIICTNSACELEAKENEREV